METNFFQQVAHLNITGDLNITIKQGTDNNFAVTALLNNQQCGDDARRLIPPLILKGTAEELDKGFFQRIASPLETTSELLVNMEAYLKQQEDARKQSAMEKEKAEKERKEKKAKDKSYKEAMRKADALEKEGKHREAWMKLPDPAEYPEHTDAIRKRREELSKHFALSLFGEKASESGQ